MSKCLNNFNSQSEYDSAMSTPNSTYEKKCEKCDNFIYLQDEGIITCNVFNSVEV